MFKFPRRTTVIPIERNTPDPGSARALLLVHSRGARTEVDARVRSVLNVVLRELEKPQSVQRIAAQVGLSPSWFEHIFKKETGHTFKVFLRTTRLAKAKDMLRDSALRVKEVAAAVGYADASDFAHDFRRQYGQSPSQLRKPPGPPLGVGGRVVRASPKPPTPNSRFHQQKAGSTNKQQISPTDYR